MENFEQAIIAERRWYQQKDICSNLMPDKEAMIKSLKRHEFLKVIPADKNCGFVLIETDHITERGLNKHLGNTEVYQ